MSDMAGFELESVVGMESLRDEYALGGMSEEAAAEHGLIGYDGVSIGMDDAIERMQIGSLDTLDSLLEIEQLNLDVSTYRMAVRISKKGELNPKAIVNLLKPLPTCNICENQMTERDGKFGIFYFCSCEDQKTVSKKYWDTARIGE